MKKYLFILLLLLIIIPFNVIAAEDYNNFTYSIDEENNTITLTKYNGNSEKVTIPSKVMKDNVEYQVIFNGAVFYNNSNVKKIIFEDGIKSGSTLRNAFRNCTNLTKVDFGNLDTRNLEDMKNLFYGDESLEEINVSSFDTSNVTDLSYMFYNCKSIKKIDLSNFDTSNAVSMQYLFYNCNSLEYLNIINFDTVNTSYFHTAFGYETIESLKTIIVGKKFRITNNYGNSFSRGTWIREEDGKHYDAVDIPFLDNPAGTYHKLTETIENLSIIKPVTYRINPVITKIDHFYTNNHDQFELVDNKGVIINHLNVQNTDDYTVPGKVELIFKDAIIDSNNNKYDLFLQIDNVHLFDINNEEGYSDFNVDILQIVTYKKVSGIGLFNYFYPDMESVKALTGSIYKQSSVFEDITLKILNKNGTPVNGNYLFSIYDLDGSSTREINSQYLHPTGTSGYGEFSEGVTLHEGFDMNSLYMHNNSFLLQLSDNRITGSRADNSSELSEFIITADSKYSKFTWNGSGNVGSLLFFRYQPQIVNFEFVNKKGELIPNAKLAIYNDNGELIEEWVTGNKTKKILLNPGKYTIKQIEKVNGYDKVKDIEFMIGLENDNQESNNTIKMIADYHITNNPNTSKTIVFIISIIVLLFTGIIIHNKIKRVNN